MPARRTIKRSTGATEEETDAIRKLVTEHDRSIGTRGNKNKYARCIPNDSLVTNTENSVATGTGEGPFHVTEERKLRKFLGSHGGADSCECIAVASAPLFLLGE